MEEPSRQIIRLALDEDLSPNGDLSSEFIFTDLETAKATIIAKAKGIMAGSATIQCIVNEYKSSTNRDFDCQIKTNFQDGQDFNRGDILFEITAPIKVLLACERTILNFLQRLCGIATKTNELVALIKNYQCKLLDTRKTSPGLRLLEKQAFASGGGTNHRLNLSDMIMLKENHLSGIKDIREAINTIRKRLPNIKIEVEVNKDNLAKLKNILNADINIIMLDNFSATECADLIIQIRKLNPQIKIELSGGINETNIIDYAKALPDYISTSIVTTKANNIDLSMLIN